MGDTLRAHGGQRDRDLGVMHASRGQHRRDRNHAVRHVQMQLVANPAGLETLAVALAAHVRSRRRPVDCEPAPRARAAVVPPVHMSTARTAQSPRIPGCAASATSSASASAKQKHPLRPGATTGAER